MKYLRMDVFDSGSIDRVIKELNSLNSQLENATNNMIKHLVDFGIHYIQSEAPGLDVHAEQTGNGSWSIIAEEDYVIALEFGEGVTIAELKEATRSGRYVKDPRKISGLDEINKFRTSGYVPGSGSHMPPQQVEDEDDDAIDAMILHQQMVMYRAAQAIREEIPHAARMFFRK